MTRMRLDTAEIVAKWVPGSQEQPWTWDDESRDIESRVCVCCDQPGHYQRQIVEKMQAEGEWWEEATILLGPDGRVWDGHHRIVAAIDLAVESLSVELAGGEQP